MAENQKITLKNGKEVNVTITNWIDQKGIKFSTAIDKKGNKYKIVNRDFEGAIWEKE